MNETVIAAGIAAIVSLLVSLLTANYERRKLASEERRHERELRRRLTEKMLDLRLVAYPDAFRITDQLTGHKLFHGDRPISSSYLREVLEDLTEWHRTKAGFLLTRGSIHTYQALRDALYAKPVDSTYSHSQLERIWKAKNSFRGALGSDLRLFYEEDPPARFEGIPPSEQIPVAPEG